MTPRFLTWEETEEKCLPSPFIRPLLNFGGPNTITSVFSSLSRRKLFDNHFLMSPRQANKGSMVSPAFNGMYNWVSSAYKWNETLCLLIISPNGRIYKLKRSGPKMDPWGTPQIIGATDEENLPNSTEKVLSLIYELHHCKAITPIPNKRSNRQRRILWSTVSKAAVRSRSRSTVFLPLQVNCHWTL